MKYFCLLFLFYLFTKNYFYADYETKEKNNKSIGIILKLLSFLGLILSIFILFYFY